MNKMFAVVVSISAIGCAAPVSCEVAIVDGDTFDLDGVRIRINGIDAPEYGQNCGSWDCGAESLDYLNFLINSGRVECKSLGDDGYGRVIGKCKVAGQDIGAAMVLHGLAYAFVKYSTDYVQEEEVAREQAIGIWEGNYQRPWDFRQEKWASAEQDSPAGCPIKGNISENGHIYHAPWSPWYKKTRINEGNGERWFCSEAEAVAAGWRSPRWR